ncbi:T9SS type A sorting domain-containing protein [Aquimarina brevivitae]|uniref:Putative secreted protein (Por secretion system target) n=1 Tax=Aquimarina brevivitae TaxID=323412 RepID=A0A4Q7P2I0_9FLAO|nr:T9SS type A sorting domain-containing protein [Aquimarina brevivitae]RZS93807.1 putative secreted protein (Por secretion system target) [Aquimarina brevivitae]
MKTNLQFIKCFYLTLLITLVLPLTSLAQQVIDATIQFDGRTRAYRLYVPQSYDPSQPAPLLLNYHGYTNTIEIQYNQSNFQQLAEDNQFLFVTPQGLGNTPGWAINNFFGGNEDDLGFTDALIDKISSEYTINQKRIYATGFSNGGYFSYRLACELSPRIAAIASVAGSMTARWIDNGQCQPQHPTAVLQITGTNDNVIPISGGALGKSIPDVMEYWASYNNADLTPDIIDLGGGSTRSIWDNGDNGVTVEFIRVAGKGHSWNGGNVATSQEVWNFLSRFTIDGAIDQTPPTDEICEGNISSFPYSESFEGTIGDWTQSTRDNLNFTINQGGTPSSGTGPSSAIDGSSYIYIEASGNGTGYPNKNATLNSPCLDLSNLTTADLAFQYHMLGATIGSLTVEARTDNQGDWLPVFTVSGSQGDQWNSVIIDLDAYAGNPSVQLRISALTGSSFTGDIAIDALQIDDVITDPTDPGNTICQGSINSFPFVASFESNLNDWTQEPSGDDLDWTRNSGGTPSSGTGPDGAVDGNVYVYVEASGEGVGYPNKRAILNSPCLDFSNVNDPLISFQYHMEGSEIETLALEARLNNVGEWVSIFNRTGSQGSSWNLATVDLTAFAGEGSVQLRFNAVTGNGTSGWQSDIALDAVQIQNGTVDPPSECDAINFDNFQIISFSNQDVAGDFAANGTSLALQNNTWKYIALNYTVTPNTVISFDFSSTNQGEIHGIGFEDNNTLTSTRYFKVYGTQNYGITNYDNYGGGTVSYTIPVGAFYTGNFDRLVFINDDDTGFGNTSLFSNVRIYEGSCVAVQLAQRALSSTNVTPIYGDEDEEGPFRISVYPNPVQNQFSLQIAAKSNSETTLQIFSILGQQKYVAQLAKGTHNFSVSNLGLSAGIYIIKLSMRDGTTVEKKLVVQ